MSETRFDPGQVVATPAALAAIRKAGQAVTNLLDRHLTGDWGDLDAEDAHLNDAAVQDGGRLLSSYRFETGDCVWIITEAIGDDRRRASTCLLLPSEY